jgi:hypothetical protein
VGIQRIDKDKKQKIEENLQKEALEKKIFKKFMIPQPS